MAQTLTKFNVTLTIDGLKKNTADLSTATDPLPFTKRYTFTNGEGVNQAEEFWSDTRSLAATTADNLDLASSLVGSLGLGATILFKAIKAIIIVHKTAAASAALQVGGHATLALTTMFTATPDLDTAQPALLVRPGGMLVLVANDATGYAVTATTKDMLRIYNGAAASVDYDVIILGTV